MSGKRKQDSTATKVAEALSEPGDTFVLTKKAPHRTRVHQAVCKLRKDGLTITTERTAKGTVYTVEDVPNGEVEEQALPVIHTRMEPMRRHPSLGDVRITSLGEHPSGRIVAGLRDSDGKRWLAMLVEEEDL